jgi:hypothetical protein
VEEGVRFTVILEMVAAVFMVNVLVVAITVEAIVMM